MSDVGRLDLNLMPTFMAIWRERSVSRATLHLNLSQSAVSDALARLRQMVDDPLFVRDCTGMAPTPREIEMAPLLEAALAQIETALSPQRPFQPGALAGPLCIGISDDFMLAWRRDIDAHPANRWIRQIVQGIWRTAQAG